jgi:ABC-type nickel/cobalt efflux system permease component RcnA
VGLTIFRLATAIITCALVIFVLWITEGSTAGRLIAGGVLVFGFAQWWILRRLGHQQRAEPAETLEDQG